ncbi:hypothetical protein [Streptomyces sp. NPDC002913]
MNTHGPGPLQAGEQSGLRRGPDPDQLPAALSEPTGPTSGTVSLPLHLACPGLRTFALSDENLRLGMCRIALNTGLYEDYVRYLDGDLLACSWPRLQKMVGRGIRTAWEEIVPGLYTNSTEAAA